MFGEHDNNAAAGRCVANLTKQERRSIMHTGDKLADVRWRIDTEGRLIPSSFCDHDYLEQAFEHDQAFFLKTIGGQNSVEMRQTLLDNPRTMLSDSEFFKAASETAFRWFQTDLAQLSLNQKARIIPYLRRTMHTTIPQLSRTFGINRKLIAQMIGK